MRQISKHTALGIMALAAGIAIVDGDAAWQAARAQTIANINARVIAINIPGASAISQVGTFLPGPPTPFGQCTLPHPIPTLFPSYIQPGAVLDPNRIPVGSSSNFGTPLATGVGQEGALLSIDLIGPGVLSVPPNFAQSGDQASTLGGGRRSVEPEDLATGNAADGRAYFNGAGGCSGCHSPTEDLAGIAKRYQGLTLLQRMLYPSGRPAPALPKAIFTLASGQSVVAPLTAEDEFTVTVMDPLGAPQTYKRTAVKVKIENPMTAHFEQLGKYTDASMHNIYAYLDTLK